MYIRFAIFNYVFVQVDSQPVSTLTYLLLNRVLIINRSNAKAQKQVLKYDDDDVSLFIIFRFHCTAYSTIIYFIYTSNDT